jgi:hypothetical protein
MEHLSLDMEQQVQWIEEYCSLSTFKVAEVVSLAAGAITVISNGAV